MKEAESFQIKSRYRITQSEVRRAWRYVKSKGGAAGVDGITAEEYSKDLDNNLYKLWNRMCSGSYSPSPVRLVVIPKSNGGTRPLGIPTVDDRVAQKVVQMRLEPKLDPMFLNESFGYRPNKRATDAVEVTKKNCWKYQWGIDLDIQGFFDNMEHDKTMIAVRKHIQEKWMLLYIERWLKAPLQKPDGNLVARKQGTPQGGVISPILSNLFLHYALDSWMKKFYPWIPFTRYADDAICHCRTEAQARRILAALRQRMAECGLILHPEKTVIFHCRGRDSGRRGDDISSSFTFLGFTFKPLKTMNRKTGEAFMGFGPTISNKAKKKIGENIKKLGVHRRVEMNLEEIAKMVNPRARGWINYYGTQNPTKVRTELGWMIDRRLIAWAKNKLKSLSGSWAQAYSFIMTIKEHHPGLLAHWTN